MWQLYAFASLIVLGYAIRAKWALANRNFRAELLNKQMKLVIIGASEGIGRQLAMKYATSMVNSKIILVARQEQKLLKVKAEIDALRQFNVKQTGAEYDKGTVDVVTCDLTKSDQLDALVKRISEIFNGSVDRIVWNAGSISCLTVEELLETEKNKEVIEYLFKLNLLAPIEFSMKALELMKNSEMKGKSFVVVSSVAGRIGAPTRSLYAASKHGLNGYFDSFRIEVEKYGIGVTLVCPGTVADTNLRFNSVESRLSKPADKPLVKFTKGSITAEQCAIAIFDAAETNKREVWVPKYQQLILPLLYYFAPAFVDSMAKAKYGYY